MLGVYRPTDDPTHKAVRLCVWMKLAAGCWARLVSHATSPWSVPIGAIGSTSGAGWPSKLAVAWPSCCWPAGAVIRQSMAHSTPEESTNGVEDCPPGPTSGTPRPHPFSSKGARRRDKADQVVDLRSPSNSCYDVIPERQDVLGHGFDDDSWSVRPTDYPRCTWLQHPVPGECAHVQPWQSVCGKASNPLRPPS